LDRSNAEAHDDLGVILAQRGEHAAARTHFLAAIAADPTYQKVYHNLAMVHYITGDNERALAAIDDALGLSPDSRNSLLLKAAILEALGRGAEAGRLREEAEFLPEGNWTERMPVR
jgi:tetratricopeptide (TPR) repeat protein